MIREEHDYVDEFIKLFKAKNKNITDDCFKYQGRETLKGESVHKYVVKDGERPLAYGFGKT